MHMTYASVNCHFFYTETMELLVNAAESVSCRAYCQKPCKHVHVHVTCKLTNQNTEKLQCLQ